MLSQGFSISASILNVNIPEGATCTTEIRQTRQSRRNYSAFNKPKQRDFKKGYTLTSSMDVNLDRTEKNSDIYALYYDQVISLTPLTWDLSVMLDWDL